MLHYIVDFHHHQYTHFKCTHVISVFQEVNEVSETDTLPLIISNALNENTQILMLTS